MRPIRPLLLLAFLCGCAAAPRVVKTENDMVLSLAQVADDLVTADFVALGELHQTPPVHRTHHELLELMFARRPNMVIAMEQFERDVYPVLLQYLDGAMSESEFLTKARPWPHYERDYKPVIEFARKNKIVVLAANAPRSLARKAAKEGLDAVMPHEDLARETTAPLDEYWDDFQESMEGHEGMFGPGGMERYYAAQCLKDDTMAESLADYLKERYAAGDRPLAVLICGKMHSDHGRGTVARVAQRLPGITVRVLSAETVADMGSGVYDSPRDVGDYVVVAPAQADEPKAAMPKPKAQPKPEQGDDEPTENPEGLRPAFGFRPDYAGEDEGVGVGGVTEGGPAEAAGIEEGDRIVAVDGIPTPDVEMYAEVLDTLIIGRTVLVKIVRGGEQREMKVRVGSRPDNR